MWEDLIKKAKFGGLDVIETYVFWNGHEPSPGIYNFEGRYDLVRFIKTIQKERLYVFLRIGPYVCAEWNFGGFPVWLKFVPGISFRTDNELFKNAMQSFTQKIVDLMKSENLFASQGGPIILSQIENEYGPLGKRIGNEGYNYMNWAAQMAVGMGTGVPCVMCKQDDAPDPVCYMVARLIRAMDSIVIISPLIKITSPRFGLRHGLAASRNGHTSKGRNYASVVPHPTSIRISHRTHFNLVNNENIPVYHFDFVPLETSEERLAKGSPLSDFVGRSELIIEIIPTTERKTGNTLHLWRVTIMDDRFTIELPLSPKKSRSSLETTED
ncbi:hypothetical protein CASFOL_017621 [Castilleja foliolosa]|uniref:beta-galactosidase n=1 Tax=Castilleja foliolosa TaxID=1961234 RepID=A0ABD3D7G3_9LAMI